MMLRGFHCWRRTPRVERDGMVWWCTLLVYLLIGGVLGSTGSRAFATESYERGEGFVRVFGLFVLWFL